MFSVQRRFVIPVLFHTLLSFNSHKSISYHTKFQALHSGFQALPGINFSFSDSSPQGLERAKETCIRVKPH